ncbi:MAG: hypothetical protein HKP26_01705 [Nitrosopumilus sp.]|nr:hypothetical protein [Nitrosopumilus sp.]
MGKIRIRTGRGTGTIEVDDDASKWSGDDFKKIQAARKKAASNRTVSSGRGTGSRKLGDTPESKSTTSTKGRTISTGRGTGSRKSSK